MVIYLLIDFQLRCLVAGGRGECQMQEYKTGILQQLWIFDDFCNRDEGMHGLVNTRALLTLRTWSYCGLGESIFWSQFPVVKKIPRFLECIGQVQRSRRFFHQLQFKLDTSIIELIRQIFGCVMLWTFSILVRLECVISNGILECNLLMSVSRAHFFIIFFIWSIPRFNFASSAWFSNHITTINIC